MLARKFSPMVGKSDVPTIAQGWVDEAYSGAGKGAIHDSACGIMMAFLESILGVAPAEPGVWALPH